MRILGLIPARGGSKGIPGKNIKLLAGKPLLQYTWDAAQEASQLSRVVLSSDNDAIIEVAKSLNLEVPFKRPAELAGDATSSLEVIQHALEELNSRGENFDAVCLLQPTSPFRNKGLIDSCIQKFLDGNYDSLVSVREVPEEYNPHWVFEEKEGILKIATGEKKIISRRQDLPKAYHRDGAVYLTKTHIVLEKNSLFGEKTGFYDTGKAPYVNIDTPADWLQAEKILKECAE